MQANILALRNTTADHIFNIGTSIETSVNELFNTLKKIITPSFPEKHASSKLGEQRRSVIDFAKAKSVLKWEPAVSLSEGLKNTCEYFK